MDDARERARAQVGALMVCGYQEAGPPGEAFLERVRTGRMGGVILFARNTPSLASLAEIRRALDEAAGQDLLVAIDEEGGWVSRLPAPWPRLPAAMALGSAASQRPEAVRAYARRLGLGLRALGINQDYAPVLDVNTAPDNPIIGSRAFGDDAEAVGRLGSAFAQGLEDAGVVATGKHFPGHGATRVDSHLDLPVLDFDLERLTRLELLPFARAAAAGMSAFMTAHVALPRVAEAPVLPATVSRRVLTDIARHKLGFDGLVVTDCMEMQGVARAYGTARASVMAVAAGADQVLVSHTADLQAATFEALERAVTDGEIPPERVFEAAGRVERLRRRVASLPPAPPLAEALERLAQAADRLSGESVYEAPGADAKAHPAPDVWLVPGQGSARWRSVVAPAGAAVARALGAGPGARTIAVDEGGTPEARPEPGQRLALLVPSLRRFPGWLALWRGLAQHPRVAVLIQDPYDAARLPDAERIVVAPTPSPAAVLRAVAVVLGEARAEGLAPIDLRGVGEELAAASFTALEEPLDASTPARLLPQSGEGTGGV